MSVLVKYGAVDLICRMDALTITFRKVEEIKHAPDTDRSVSAYLGVQATELSGAFIGYGKDDMVIMQSLIHGEQEENLIIGDWYYYSNVITSSEASIRPINPEATIWELQITFIALSPKPRDITTGEELY